MSQAVDKSGTTRFAESLLRDISAHLEIVTTRLEQLPEEADLPERTETALDDLRGAISALRRYR